MVLLLMLFFATIDKTGFLIFTIVLKQILHQKLKSKFFLLWIFASLIYLMEEPLYTII